jgi:hypothetical protein
LRASVQISMSAARSGFASVIELPQLDWPDGVTCAAA